MTTMFNLILKIMTTKELENKIKAIRFTGYGSWEVTFEYRGTHYGYITHDARIIDRINEHKVGITDDKESSMSYTYKQALESLYIDGLIKWELGKYKVS